MKAVVLLSESAQKMTYRDEALSKAIGFDLGVSGSLPDVILVDWNMPVMDGLTFIKQCRAHEDYRDIALMMVTTESEQSNIVRALAAGAHEYVIKPFTDEVITEKLQLLGLVSA